MPTSQKSKPDNPEQSKRFMETARELGTDESPEAFDRTLKRVAPGKPAPKAPSDSKS